MEAFLEDLSGFLQIVTSLTIVAAIVCFGVISITRLFSGSFSGVVQAVLIAGAGVVLVCLARYHTDHSVSVIQDIIDRQEEAASSEG